MFSTDNQVENPLFPQIINSFGNFFKKKKRPLEFDEELLGVYQ